MDQKRLFLAIAVSLAILLGFQMLVAPHLPKPARPRRSRSSTTARRTCSDAAGGRARRRRSAAPAAVPANVPRVKIDAPRVEGSISLLGAASMTSC